jgi:hypothetical protein
MPRIIIYTDSSGKLLSAVLRISTVLFVTILFIFLNKPTSVLAELKPMSEDALKSSTAQAGFTTFSMSETTAQLFLDIHIETYATIRSFSAGYYTSMINNELGWDQKWNNISIGNSIEDPLVIDGLLFIAEFNDISSSNRELQRVVIGSNRLQGSITADFASFSGAYSDAVLSGGGAQIYRQPLGMVTMNFDSSSADKGLYFVLTLTGSKAGIQVVADKNNISTGDWWNSP